MRPARRRSIALTTGRPTASNPPRLTSRIWSHSRSEVSAKRPSWVMPALSTNAAGGPCRSISVRTAASAAFRSARFEADHLRFRPTPLDDRRGHCPGGLGVRSIVEPDPEAGFGEGESHCCSDSSTRSGDQGLLHGGTTQYFSGTKRRPFSDFWSS